MAGEGRGNPHRLNTDWVCQNSSGSGQAVAEPRGGLRRTVSTPLQQLLVSKLQPEGRSLTTKQMAFFALLTRVSVRSSRDQV